MHTERKKKNEKKRKYSINMESEREEGGGREAGREGGGETDRQTDRQTDRERGRHRDGQQTDRDSMGWGVGSEENTHCNTFLTFK